MARRLTPASPGRVKRILEDYFELSERSAGAAVLDDQTVEPCRDAPAWIRWRAQVGAIIADLSRDRRGAIWDWWGARAVEAGFRASMQAERDRHERLLRHAADLRTLKRGSAEPKIVQFALSKAEDEVKRSLDQCDFLERCHAEAARMLDSFRRRKMFHRAITELGMEFARRQIRPFLRHRYPGGGRRRAGGEAA